jgi:hypothetical protein
MYLTSKIRRCLSNIQTFLNSNSTNSKDPSYKSTCDSLRQCSNILNGHLMKGERRESSRGSHYVTCKATSNNCKCISDNNAIIIDIEIANRLMKRF